MDERQTTLGRIATETRTDTRGEPTTQAELLDAAEQYAQTVAIDVDLDEVSWEVSMRAKRRAGACIYHRGTGDITIRLAWRAFENYDWDGFQAVIRHELVHAWEYQQFGKSSHGRRFKQKAAELDVSVHCPTFTEGRLRLLCTNEDCNWSATRHRASAAVTEPEKRRCGSCGERYRVEHIETGQRWRTKAGYERAREAIGEQW